MKFLAVLALTVACGGSPKPKPAPAPDPIPKSAGPNCDVVADKLAIVIHADAPDAQAGANVQLRTRCSEDKWSDEARSCFATVDTDQELEGCKQHLSDAQKTGFAALAPSHDSRRDVTAPAEKPKAKRSRGPKGDSSDPQEGGQ